MYVNLNTINIEKQKRKRYNMIIYGPHKAMAEVSNHNEPIGRKSGIQLVRKSKDFTFNFVEIQMN